MSNKLFNIKEEDSIESMIMKQREYWNGRVNLNVLNVNEIKPYIITAFRMINTELNNINILDFGCGDGRLYEIIKNYNVNYRGVDICESLINRSKSKTDSKDIFSVIEHKIPFEDNYFDIILCYSVFTHISHKQIHVALDEFHRVLKPNSYCLTSVIIKEMIPNLPDNLENIAINEFHEMLLKHEFSIIGIIFVPDPTINRLQSLYCLRCNK